MRISNAMYKIEERLCSNFTPTTPYRMTQSVEHHFCQGAAPRWSPQRPDFRVFLAIAQPQEIMARTPVITLQYNLHLSTS